MKAQVLEIDCDGMGYDGLGCKVRGAVIRTGLTDAFEKQAAWRPITVLGGWRLSDAEGDLCPGCNSQVPGGHLSDAKRVAIVMPQEPQQ